MTRLEVVKKGARERDEYIVEKLQKIQSGCGEEVNQDPPCGGSR